MGTVKSVVSVVILASSVILSATSAFAWGCIAVSEEGTYGYSYEYSSQSKAEDRALNECAANTTEDSDCEIVECDENS